MSIIKTAYVIIAIINIFHKYFPTQYDKTALHYASEKGHLKVVMLLIQSHADVNIKGYVSTKSPH